MINNNIARGKLHKPSSLPSHSCIFVNLKSLDQTEPMWEGHFYWHKDNEHNNSLPITRQSVYIEGLIH